MTELSGGDKFWSRKGDGGGGVTTKNRYNWGDPRFQKLFGNIITDAEGLTQQGGTPQLSDQYWNQLQDQAIQGIQSGAGTQQNQVMEQLARRGLADSGAAGAALSSLANQQSANQAAVLRDLGLQRQQSELQNQWQARQHQMSAAGLGMQYSQAAQSARNAAAARSRAASQQEWNRQQQMFGMMGGMLGGNQGNQRADFNTQLNGYMQPQQMALQQMQGAPASNQGLGSFLGGLGGVATAFLGNKGGGGGGWFT